MISKLPEDNQRLRCGRCGNLTRFDIRRSATTKEFWHLDISGEVKVEEVEVLEESLISVSCRWCGAVEEVEVSSRLES